MTKDTESLCALLVKDQSDIAGEVVDTDLQLRASAVNSVLGDVVENNSIFTERIYREDRKSVGNCIETASKGNVAETRLRVQLSADEWCIFDVIIYPPDHFAAGSGLIFTAENVTHSHFSTQRREVINRVLRHNLRTDMQVIKGYLDIVREGCAESDQMAIEQIETTTNKLLLLGEKIRDIDSLLTAANYQLRHVQLQDIVERVVAQYHEAHPDVIFKTTVGDHVIAGNSLVTDAIEELIENAIEHTDTGTEPTVISVTSELHAETDEVLLRITDNGQGIPKGEVKAISEATESELNHSGGVGLWLVKWITDSIQATFDIGQRESTRGTWAELGFRTADQLDEFSDRQDTELQQKRLIRTKLPDTGSTDIATSTRG